MKIDIFLKNLTIYSFPEAYVGTSRDRLLNYGTFPYYTGRLATLLYTINTIL